MTKTSPYDYGPACEVCHEADPTKLTYLPTLGVTLCDEHLGPIPPWAKEGHTP